MFRVSLLFALLFVSIINLTFAEKPEYWSNGRQYMTERMLILKSDKKILREHKFKEWKQEKREIIPVIINLNICSEDEGTDILADMSLEDRILTQQDRILDNLLKNKKVKVRHIFELIPSISCEIPANLIKPLSINPWIDSIEPIEQGELLTKDGIPQIGGNIYRNQYTGAGISIAIIDSGVDGTHPLLGPKIIGGYDYRGEGNYATPSLNCDGTEEDHGTKCAGIAAGSLGFGNYIHEEYIGGVAPDAKIYSLKVSRDAQFACPAYDEDDVVDAILWCVIHQNDNSQNPILVINMSLGAHFFPFPVVNFTDECDTSYPSFFSAANVACDSGISLVAASGNDGDTNGITRPACFSNVISVGAVYDYPGSYNDGCTDNAAVDKVACFSNSAPILDLLAPSAYARTTTIFDEPRFRYFDIMDGTSAASPYVAGGIAVIQQASMDMTNRYRTPIEIMNILYSTGPNIQDHRNNIYTRRINIAEAIQSMMHKVTASAVGNGTIDPAGNVYVKPNGSQVFNAAPNAGYVVDVWKKNGTPVQTGQNSYTLTNVAAPCTIEVTFKQSSSNFTTETFNASETDKIYSAWPDNAQSGTTLQITNEVDNKGHGLVRFNLSSIPLGSVVNAADFKMYCYADSYSGRININRSQKNWTSAITWNTYYPTAALVIAENTDKGGVNSWWVWNSSSYPDLKNTVQDWVDGESNYGFLVTPWSSSDLPKSVHFAGVGSTYNNPPQLVVNYTPPSSPDLIVTHLSPNIPPVAGIYYVGDTITWDVDVKNNSTQGYAPETQASFHLVSSPTEALDSQNFFADQTIDPLGPGESDGGAESYTFQDSDAGMRYVVAKADYEVDVIEADETNNIRVYGPFTVTKPGSLFVLLEPMVTFFDHPEAKWSIDGTNWNNSGQTLTNIRAGNYTIMCQPVDGWNSPANDPVQIKNNTVSSLSQVYTELPDINRNRTIDIVDFSLFAAQWQNIDCAGPAWCAGTDLDKSGTVNFTDLAMLADNWLNQYLWDSTWLENLNFENGNYAYWQNNCSCNSYVEISTDNPKEGNYCAILQCHYFEMPNPEDPAGPIIIPGELLFTRLFNLPWWGEYEVLFDYQVLLDNGYAYVSVNGDIGEYLHNQEWSTFSWTTFPNERSVDLRFELYGDMILKIDNIRIIPLEIEPPTIGLLMKQ